MLLDPKGPSADMKIKDLETAAIRPASRLGEQEKSLAAATRQALPDYSGATTAQS